MTPSARRAILDLLRSGVLEGMPQGVAVSMDPPSSDSQETRVADLFAQFVSQRESGSSVGFEAWVRDHPEVAPELRDLHEGWEAFEATFEAALPAAATPFIHRMRDPAGLDPERIMAEARPGMVIGDFLLIRKLGQGGMGQVWEARQASLDRRVALKLVRPDRATHESARFFRREARAGGRLSHPCIVGVHATGESEGVRWIAQELVEGGCTFDDFVQDMRGLDHLPPDYYRRIARFFVDIAQALQTAHDAGVIHRDIKPQNVLVTPDDRPKVTDFGLARIVDEGSVTGLSLVGTPHYMSPEQAIGAELDHRTDVFSLGVLFYEALALRRPFEGENQAELYEAILRQDPPDPRTIRPHVPRDLAVIALKALEKRKTLRYPTMHDFAEDLRRYLEHRPILARPPGPIQLCQKWIQRHPTASVTALLAVILLMVISVAMKIVTDQLQTTQDSISLAEDHRRQSLILQVQWASEIGDLDRAGHLLEQANAIDPNDPQGHLLLAIGYLRFGQRGDAERELDLAVQKGFTSDGRNLHSANDYLHHGLHQYYHYLKKREVIYLDLADRHLSQAWSMDPELKGVLYPLYQVRRFLDDDEGAYEALMAYKQRLATGSVFYPMVEALGYELQREFERAAHTLEALAQDPTVDEEKLVDLSFHRALGRIYILLGRMEDARGFLEQAVEAYPSDGGAWANLAAASHALARENPDPEARRVHLDRARSAAERAHEELPRYLSPLRELASIEISTLHGRIQEKLPPQPEDWERARYRLAELRLSSPSDADLLEAELLFQEGTCLSQFDGRAQRAALRFRSSLSLVPDHIGSCVLLAELLWFDQEYEEALGLLLRARDAWHKLQDEVEFSVVDFNTVRYRPRKERFWLQAAQVWIVGTAPHVGQAQLAVEARTAIDEELATGESFPIEELLSYAEFLATSPLPEVRDCARALELLETHELHGAFRGHEGAAEILQLIEDACDHL